MDSVEKLMKVDENSFIYLIIKGNEQPLHGRPRSDSIHSIEKVENMRLLFGWIHMNSFHSNIANFHVISLIYVCKSV
jgi:hypothetical protein